MANWVLYDNFRLKQARGNGAINLESLDVYCALVTGSYTPNQNTHDFFDDITNEATGTGYTAGGNLVDNVLGTMDGSGNVKIDGDDPAAWAQDAGGFSAARRAILYVKRGGAASADELIAYSEDFGADKGNVDGDFSIQLDAAGIFTSAR